MDKISSRQFTALAFVALLSPLVRRIPRSLVMVSGGAAWLAVPIAGAAVLLIYLLLGRCIAGGQGLGQLICSSLGKVLGRLLIGLIALWLTFYSGFLLRSGADRFVSTIYPESTPWIFVLGMALLCLPALLGRFSALARSAMIFRPLLLGVLLVVCAFALSSSSFRGVLNITREDIVPCLKSGWTVTNTLSLAVYLGFAAQHREGETHLRSFALWALVLLAVTEAMTLCCLGVFGTELTLKLNYPFFMLVRDISLFDSIARLEALIVAVWIFADFIHISVLLSIAGDNLSCSFGLEKRWPALLCLGTAAVLGIVLAPDMLSLGRLSEQIVPLGNSIVIFGLIPLSLLVGKIRGKV